MTPQQNRPSLASKDPKPTIVEDLLRDARLATNLPLEDFKGGWPVDWNTSPERFHAIEWELQATRDQLREEEDRTARLKLATWLLVAVIGILLFSVAEIQGCVSHTGDTGDELPY